MADILNWFQSDDPDGMGFDNATLTAAIEKLPYSPGVLEGMGIFVDEPLSNITVNIEELDGKLGLIPNKPRGGGNTAAPTEKRTLRTIEVPHYPEFDFIDADSFTSARTFGTNQTKANINVLVNRRLSRLNARHALTREHAMAGAVQGKIKNHLGDDLVDLLDIMGVSQQSVNFALNDSSTEVADKVDDALDKQQAQLGHASGFVTGQVAIAGQTFFNSLRRHSKVKTDINSGPRDNAGQFNFGNLWNSFELYGVTWVRYPSGRKVSNQTFVDNKHAFLLPIGVPDMYNLALAPANKLSAVGQLGTRIYVRSYVPESDDGIVIDSQSNILPYVTRPNGIVKLTTP